MRIRTIKPEFWTDDAVTECSLNARLLLIGALNIADDQGSLERSAKQIKAKIFPNDNIDCEPLVGELITHGLLIEYEFDDKKYLHIKGFKKHQVINRPSKNRVPIYEDSLRTHGVVSDPSVTEVEVEVEGKGGEGKGKNKRGQAAPSCPEDVPEQTWKDFIALRKSKKAPLTETALSGLRRNATSAGWTLSEAIELCCMRGWAGFDPAWITPVDAQQFGKTSQGIALLESMKG